MKAGNPITKVVMIIVSVLLSLFIAEIVLRWIIPDDNLYYVWQPNLQHTFYPDTTIFYGIKGKKKFTINRHGYRGKEFSEETKNYLCLGGSTTECLYLDDTETWWALLEKNLNENNTPQQYVFGSIGKSGCTTREHYIQFKYYVPQLKNVKGIILMVGLNDMMKRLSADSLYDPAFTFTEEVESSFVNTTLLHTGFRSEIKWYRRTALFKLLQKLYHQIKPVDNQKMIQNENGMVYKLWRSYRKNAIAFVDSLPDLTPALNEFERNLRSIHDEAKKQGLQLILITQVSLYKDSMSAYEQSLLWMGGIGNFQVEEGHAYYTSGALNDALEMYNARLAKFCSNNPDILFIDIKSALPKDTSVFYDDCHFNENGARLFARYLANEFFR